MADTPRPLPDILAIFADGQADASITPQDMRDFVVSVNRLFNLYTSPSYANDTAAAAGGVQLGDVYRNGNFVMVRVS